MPQLQQRLGTPRMAPGSGGTIGMFAMNSAVQPKGSNSMTSRKVEMGFVASQGRNNRAGFGLQEDFRASDRPYLNESSNYLRII